MLSATLDMEIAFGGCSDCISRFDKAGLIESIRLVLTSSFGVGLPFGGSSGCNSCFDIEDLRIEPIKLEVTVSLGL